MYETIRYLREKNRYSQTYLAIQLKISRQMYIKYENGVVEPPVDVIKNLCLFYKVSYETILDDKFKEQNVTRYQLIEETENNGSCIVAEPVVEYNPKNSLDIAIEQLKSLSDEKLSYAASYIKFLLYSDSDRNYFNRDYKALKKYAGKIHLDSTEVDRSREESLI